MNTAVCSKTLQYILCFYVSKPARFCTFLSTGGILESLLIEFLKAMRQQHPHNARGEARRRKPVLKPPPPPINSHDKKKQFSPALAQELHVYNIKCTAV